MTWGSWGKNLNESEMAGRIEAALQMGIHSFDHADIYGGYTTEAAFGAAFKASGVDREDVLFISKCGIQYPCETRTLEVKHYDYSATHIAFSVDNSLKHLQTDYLDLLLLHRPSPLLNVNEVAETLLRLQASGKIRAIGVSNFLPSQMDLLRKELPLGWNQLECSLTHQEPMTDGTLDYAQTHRIGTMAWSPLGSYFKESDACHQRLEPLLKELSKKYDATEDQLLLAWLLHHPAHIHPVIGTTDIGRMQNAMDACTLSLDIQDWFRLYEASRGHRVA